MKQGGLINIFANHHYRELLWELTKREIAARYKQSILGYFWVILSPALQMLIMSFVFQYIFRSTNLGVPYPIFLFAGLLTWNLFSASLNASSNALVSNAGLLKKIYFPREILLLSTILAKNVDLILSATVFVAMMFFFRLGVNFNVLWFIPILLIQNLLAYGLGLFLAVGNLFYRDIQYALNLVILLWMYLTPVMYTPDIFPSSVAWIFKLNPMAVIINAYRATILGGQLPNFASLGIAVLISLILIGVGGAWFRKMEGKFADVV